MSQPIKGVLFDLDNTLIDWHDAGDWGYHERIHLNNILQYLAEKERPLSCDLDELATSFREYAISAWEESRTTLRAPHLIKVMEIVLNNFGFTPDDTITMRDVFIAYDWGEEDGVKVFPDVPQALQQLLDDGIKIGIVTNAWQPMWLRDAELEHHDLLKFFPQENLRISAADVGYLKPHPNIFLHALEQLGTTPNETLYVGDNPTADIAGSQGVGMRGILRVNHSKPPPLISGLIVPDATVTDFEQLLLLVQDWETHATVLK